MPTARLLSLFLACFASIGYEIALARFFALSGRSEYGYWVISIAMVGLAAGGAVASLALNPLVRLAVRVSPPRLDIPRPDICTPQETMRAFVVQKYNQKNARRAGISTTHAI